MKTLVFGSAFLFVLFCLASQSAVRAEEIKPDFKDYLANSHAANLADAIGSYETALTSDLANKKAAAAALAESQRATALALKKAQEELVEANKVKGVLDGAQKAADSNYNAMNTQYSEARKNWDSKNWFTRLFSSKPNEITKVEDQAKTAIKAAEDVQEMTSEVGKLEKSEQAVTGSLASIGVGLKAANEKFEASNKKFKDGKLSDDTLYQGTKELVKQMFDKQKESYFDAKLLLTSTDTLGAKFQLTGVKLQALIDTQHKYLEDTLLGNFISKKVNASYSAPEFCMKVKECGPGGGAVSGALEKLIPPQAPAAPGPGGQKKNKTGVLPQTL